MIIELNVVLSVKLILQCPEEVPMCRCAGWSKEVLALLIIQIFIIERYQRRNRHVHLIPLPLKAQNDAVGIVVKVGERGVFHIAHKL